MPNTQKYTVSMEKKTYPRQLKLLELMMFREQAVRRIQSDIVMERVCKGVGFPQQVNEGAKHIRKTRPYGNMGQVILEVE